VAFEAAGAPHRFTAGSEKGAELFKFFSGQG
jgi:hypothetical protein